MNTPDDIARPWLASYKEGVPHTFSGSKYENLGAFLEDMSAPPPTCSSPSSSSSASWATWPPMPPSSSYRR